MRPAWCRCRHRPAELGDWPHRRLNCCWRAQAGKLSLHFVNTSGAGTLPLRLGAICAPAVGQSDRCRHSSWCGRPSFSTSRRVPSRKARSRSRSTRACRFRTIASSTPRGSRPPILRVLRRPARAPTAGVRAGYGLAVLCECSPRLDRGGCSDPKNAVGRQQRQGVDPARPFLPGGRRRHADRRLYCLWQDRQGNAERRHP